MTAFKKKFLNILEQDEVPMTDEDALASTLEPDTDPDKLGASGGSSYASQAITQREQEMVDQLTEWIKKLEQFMVYLNGTGPGSVQTVLKNSEPDTLLDKVRSTETKKIARTATDLATLIETFKGYLATSRDPKYRYQ